MTASQTLAAAWLAIAASTTFAQESNISKAAANGADTLLIAPCTTSVPLGKVNLRVTSLVRKGGVYTGEYQVKVSPLFFAGEKGRLSLACPDSLLRKLTEGDPVEFVGQAVTSRTGKTRPVRGRATPSGSSRGTVEMWFTADNTKLEFTTTYRFAGQ